MIVSFRIHVHVLIAAAIYENQNQIMLLFFQRTKKKEVGSTKQYHKNLNT